MAEHAAASADSQPRTRSGVFPQHIQAQNNEAEQTIIRNANLGLDSIRVRSIRKLRAVRALTLRNVRSPNQVHADDKTAKGRKRRRLADESADSRRSFPVRILSQRRIDTLLQAWRLSSFLDSMYVLWTVPYRLGFLFDPSETSSSGWTLELSVLTALDIAGCVLRSWILRRHLQQASRRVGMLLLALIVRLTCTKWAAVVRLHSTLAAELKPRSRSSLRLSATRSQLMAHPAAFNLIQREGTMLRRGGSMKGTAPQRLSMGGASTSTFRSSRREAERGSLLPWGFIVALVANCVPWEVIVMFTSQNYSYLHVVGVLRFLQAHTNAKAQFSSVVMPTFARWRLMQVLTFSTVSITAHLLVLGVYLCHLAACGYMLVAHSECGRSFSRCSKWPYPEAWVLRDNLEQASQLRKYVRTLYWACKTVVTLGQGDLIPATFVETAYRVCVQFVSGLWATAIITAYTFYFTHKDANMATNISTQLIQTKKFLRAREVGPELSTAVCAYFYYMERTRNGVEEAIILSNLPPHYRSQCSNYVKFKCFSQIPIFRNRQGAFLRTILGLLENDFFTPDQTVLSVGEKEEILILACGSVRIVDVKGGGLLVGRLTAGTSYAEYALFEDHVAQSQLVADSFCELWWLPRPSFEMAVHKHFANTDDTSASNMKRTASSDSAPSRNLNSLSSMQTSARMVKLAGKGSTLMKALARKGSSAGLRKRNLPLVVTWRHAHSRFRHAWVRVESVLLLWLLWEVPYHIAFQRGFGLLNDYSVHPNTGAIPVAFQRLDFFCSLLIELFFLSDLALRALFFVRPAAVGALKLELTSNGNASATTTTTTSAATTAAIALPSGSGGYARSFQDKRATFRRYLEGEPDYWLDIAANLPISLVWDVLPKEHVSERLVQVVRFARLLRLLRVRHTRRKLKAIMVELGLAPAQRMLVYIIVLCVTVVNLAGCLFFLAGDAAAFHGGLPSEGVPFSSISWQYCLEAASLADNCTWYMFDRSTFDIDAPYLRSIHWSIVLLSTVGYGDIVSFSTVECAVGCVWIFLGANICYFTSSALSSVLDQFSIVALIKDDRVEELNMALAGMPTVSDATKQAIRSFYEMKWKLNGSTLTSEELAHRLPRTLRRDLYSSLYLDDFRRCALFADCSEHDEFVRQLALVTTSEIFLKHIVVAREGHLATEFFLIQSGECECLLPAVRVPSTASSASLAIVDDGGIRWPNLSSPSTTSPFKSAAAVTTSSSLWVSWKRHNKKASLMLLAAPQPEEMTPALPRKASWTARKPARATFAAPGTALLPHIQLLNLQKRKISLFKSAANIFNGRSDRSIANTPADSDTDGKRQAVVANHRKKLQERQLQQQPRLSPHWATATAPFAAADMPQHPAAISPKRHLVTDAMAAPSLPVPSPSLASPASPLLRAKPPLPRRDTLRSVAPSSTRAAPATPVPVLMLKPSDYFGEESLLTASELYDVTVRVVSSAVQVAVVRRADFLAIAARFPKQAAKVKVRNQTQRVLDRRLLQTHRINFVAKPKIAKFFFGSQSGSQASDRADADFAVTLSVETSAGRSDGLAAFVLDPEARFAIWWRRAIRVVLVYNFFAISFRIAFLPHPKPHTMFALTCVDYLTDLLFFVDLFLKYGHMGYVELGEKVMDPAEIRRRYRNSWLWADCVSMLPLYFVTDNYWLMTLTRAPRLVRSVHLAGVAHDTHTYIQEHYLKGNTLFSSLFDLVKFFLIFLSTAHYVSCAYYLLGRLQLETGLDERSWVSMDPILLQHPRSPTVHYMRAFYWCLSTFTVDCFGDVWARNFLETLFAMFTCTLGWIFIGQVIGRINALMITLDKDRKQRNDRVEHFQQYAKQRRLPEALRLRALEGLHYKSKCSVALRLGDTLRDLPPALRAGLFYELYGPVLHSVPELHGALAPVHLEALSNALYFEIYLHGDVIYEAGRRGNRLFLLQNGLAEVYGSLTGTTYGRLEAGSCRTVTANDENGDVGALFGEFAFFLRGARRLTSVRAVRSCQVLQLDRSAWVRLWPRNIRQSIERVLLPRVQRKYRDTARALLNIDKNLFVRSDAPLPPLTANGHDVATVLAQERKSIRSWGRHSFGRPQLSSERVLLRPLRTSFTGPRPARRRSSVASVSSTESTFEVDRSEGPISASGVSARLVQLASKAPPSTSQSRRLSSMMMHRTNSLSTAIEAFDQLSAASTTTPASSQSETTTGLASVVRLGSMRRLFPNMLSGSGRRLSAPVETESKLPVNATLEVSRVTATNFILMPCRSFAVSPVLIEIQWKRHEKRLRALQLFAFSWAQVEKNVQVQQSERMKRRRSITVARGLAETLRPRVGGNRSVDDGRIRSACTFPVSSETIEAARRGPRRHSLLVVRSDLDQKFALTEEAVPLLATRVTAYLRLEARASFPVRRKSAYGGVSSGRVTSSRWASSVNIAEDAFLTDATDFDDGDNGLFDVNSKFRRSWAAVMLAVTVYHISVTPYRVAFMDGFLNDLDIEPLVGLWFTLELFLVDLVLVADFMLQLRCFAFVDGGDTISDPQAIASHYWHNGSFLLDLLSFIPFEVLLFGAAPFLGDPPPRSSPNQWPLFHSPSGGLVNWHTIAFLKLNRFLRVAHMHPLSDQLQRVLLYESTSLSKLQLRPGMLYLARLALDFLLGTHWLACIFFGVSYLNFQDGDVSWLTTPGMLTTGGCGDLADIRRVPVSEAYLRSFHFSIGAITTVCYGDILPMNAVENAATLAVILVSVVLFSMLSGGFFKFFAMELGTRAGFEERVAQVGHFMAFHDFPADMWTQMKVYFALSWQESKGLHEEQQLSGLPTTLRQDIARHVHANLIQHVRLFHGCEEPFSKAIIAAIKHEFFVRNDVIIQRGDMERSLYIVETGLVVISAVRKKKPKAAAAAARVSSLAVQGAVDGDTSQGRRGDRAKRSNVESSGRLDHGNDSVNEWLALSRQGSTLGGDEQQHATNKAATDRPRRREASVVGVVAPSGADPAPLDITTTEREERIVKGPFDYFGERSLLFGTPRNATCVAACVSSLFVLTSDRFEAILEEFPSYRSKVVRAWVMTRHSPATATAQATAAKTSSVWKAAG